VRYAAVGDDLRLLPLSMRKIHLSQLLARRPDGIFISPFEQGEIGPDIFRKACEFGLEGLVSKRRDRPYRGRPIEGLGQSEEPIAPCDGAREGRVLLIDAASRVQRQRNPSTLTAA
jgi:hypothetical protein